MKSIKIVLGLALAAFCCRGLSASQPDCGTDITTLTVGMEIDYPPFEYVGASGNVTGFDVAVACALQTKLGYGELEIINILRQDQNAALLDGTINLAISAQSIPLLFDPSTSAIAAVKYNDDSASLLFLDVIPDGITSQNALDVLNSLPTPPVLGVLQGTREASILDPMGPFPKLAAAAIFYQTYDDAIADFEDGDLDGLLLQGAVATFALEEAGGALLPNVSVPPAVGTQGLGILIASSCCQLYANVRRAIAELEYDGALPALRDEFQTGTFTSNLTPPACTGIVGVTIERNAIAQFILDKYCPCAPVIVGLPASSSAASSGPFGDPAISKKTDPKMADARFAAPATTSAVDMPADVAARTWDTPGSVVAHRAGYRETKPVQPQQGLKAPEAPARIMTEQDVIAARERAARREAALKNTKDITSE